MAALDLQYTPLIITTGLFRLPITRVVAVTMTRICRLRCSFSPYLAVNPFR